MMRDSLRNHTEVTPSAVGSMSRLAYVHARKGGAQVDALLRRAGLSRTQIDDPKARLDVRSQIKFLNLVAEAIGDDLLGFHLSKEFELREAGLLYYVLASSETLGEALRRAARYSSIVNEGVKLTVHETREIRLTYEYVGIARRLDRHQIEFFIAVLIRICRQLSNRHLLAHDVCFAHRRKVTSELSTFFGGRIKFGAEIDEATFSESVQNVPIVSADPYLNNLLVQYCEEALAHRKQTRSSFGLRVENAVALCLPHGQARVSQVARRLGLSQRTLTRRLASEGLTFSGLVKELRTDLAKRHLADRDLSISQIAWLLGYREVSAFTNAFRCWTGKAPRAARRELLLTVSRVSSPTTRQ
jgi:AraC-like DNA-binding protein